MEMNNSPIKREKTNKLTECSICCKVFTDPTNLPCIHTFCLKCLEQYCTGKNPGDNVPCPICKREFVIPDGGIRNLQQNFFIRNLLEITNFLVKATENEKCGVCSEKDKEENSDKAVSMFCIDCRQGMCDGCLTEHGKHCKSHQIVALGEELNNFKTANDNNFCGLHKKEQLKYYCSDCKMTICVTCFVEKHKAHKCSDYVNVMDELRQQMEYDVEKLKGNLIMVNEKSKQIQLDKEHFLEHILDLKSKVQGHLEALKLFLDEHAHKLCEEVDKIKENKISEIKIIQTEMNSNVDIMEELLRYYKEVKDKASDCDVACSAKELHSRTNELLEMKTKWNQSILKSFEFIPSTEDELVKDKTSNLIGTILKEENKLIKVETKANENKFLNLEVSRCFFSDVLKKAGDIIRSKGFVFFTFMLIMILIHFSFMCQLKANAEIMLKQSKESDEKAEKKFTDTIANLAEIFAVPQLNQLSRQLLQAINNTNETFFFQWCSLLLIATFMDLKLRQLSRNVIV